MVIKKRDKIFGMMFVVVVALVMMLAGCTGQSDGSTSSNAWRMGFDYLALVNKLHALPDGWEDMLETVTVTNSVGDEVEGIEAEFAQ